MDFESDGVVSGVSSGSYWTCVYVVLCAASPGLLP